MCAQAVALGVWQWVESFNFATGWNFYSAIGGKCLIRPANRYHWTLQNQQPLGRENADVSNHIQPDICSFTYYGHTFSLLAGVRAVAEVWSRNEISAGCAADTFDTCTALELGYVLCLPDRMRARHID